MLDAPAQRTPTSGPPSQEPPSPLALDPSSLPHSQPKTSQKSLNLSQKKPNYRIKNANKYAANLIIDHYASDVDDKNVQDMYERQINEEIKLTLETFGV